MKNNIIEYFPEIYDIIENTYSSDFLQKLAIKRIELFLEKNYITLDDLILLLEHSDISLEKLCNLKDKDIYFEEYFKIQNDLKIQFQKEQQGNTLKATTDMYTCRKCKEKKCSYYELQIRSSDEPMTKFIKCCNCGYEWRQNN